MAATDHVRRLRPVVFFNVTTANPPSGAFDPDRLTTTSDPSPPPMLPDVGAGQTPELRQALHELLLSAPGQLGSVYRAHATLPSARPTELLPHVDAANVGALGNRLAVIRAMTDEAYPNNAPSVARQAASSVRSLLRQATDPGVRVHLTKVAEELQLRAEDPEASQAETQALETESEALEQHVVSTLQTASGVYVYTYPHYYKHPFEPDAGRILLKVGRTEGGAWRRILSQARSTGAPETPILLRVYIVENSSDTERTFHKLLDAAQHPRSGGSGAGREWFSTTLEFLDAIAEALHLDRRSIDHERG